MRAAFAMLLVACAQGTPETVDSADDRAYTPEVFAIPLAEPERFFQTTGVDHDPEDHGDSTLGSAICTNYDGRGFPWCYDGHDGTDFLLEGGFEAMDAGSTQILAAAAGVVVSTDDGNYDRCHVEGGSVSCDGYPMVGNHVILEHPSGVRTKYWHMKSGSVAVEVGQEVACGDVLGLVGSSGLSSMPHLHFELAVDGQWVDPYAGPNSQPESWWQDQGDDPEELPPSVCP
ncbi:MAG: M23 family metallopeptidase [Deltaproteobacteria bacterium]|nr:MAG: M23 family metallopeptidase [Deltaproteobacteria bacterium]